MFCFFFARASKSLLRWYSVCLSWKLKCSLFRQWPKQSVWWRVFGRVESSRPTDSCLTGRKQFTYLGLYPPRPMWGSGLPIGLFQGHSQFSAHSVGRKSAPSSRKFQELKRRAKQMKKRLSNILHSARSLAKSTLGSREWLTGAANPCNPIKKISYPMNALSHR